MNSHRLRWRWTRVRRAAQVGFLGVFLWLFRRTESTRTGDLDPAVNILFRLDPLVAVSAMLAAREVMALV